jgi:hypothetical protein
MAPHPDRTGVFLVRAWSEEGQRPGVLRARITSSVELDDPLSTPEEVTVAGTAEEVVAALRSWLKALHAF